MLKDMVGIQLTGANFKAPTPLYFFKDGDNKRERLSVVYGKNGAGKSTISRAFNFLKGEEEDSIVDVKLKDNTGGEFEPAEEEKESIYVFNEDYIDQKIKYQEEGINTIVLLGKHKELTEKIKEVELEIKRVQERFEKKDIEFKKYSDMNNILSPDYYLAEMKKALKGTDNWATRDAKIWGKKTATQVKDDTYEKFVERKPIKGKNDLLAEFDEKWTDLQQARSGGKIITESVKTKIDITFDEELYIKLMNKKIESPELTEREKYILEILAQKGKEHIHEVKSFLQTEQNRCPFCFQPLDKTYKGEVIQNIERILSEEAKLHQKELEQLKISDIQIPMDVFEELDPDLVDVIRHAQKELDSIISNINYNIEQKISDVYSPIHSAESGLGEKMDELEGLLERLEKKRLEYNEEAQNIKKKQDIMQNINDDIAYYDVIEFYKMYIKQRKERERIEKEWKDVHEELKIQQKRKENLNIQRKNIKIAHDKINMGLKYIFYSDNRLSLEVRDEKYYLLSRGKPLKPNQISAGERNALALCYFFVDIMNDKDENEVYKYPYCLVIDDPISSLDMEIRVGLLSYLKMQIQRLIGGNSETTVLLMTHDVMTAYDLTTMLGEISEAGYTKYELVNQELQNMKKYGEYTNIMHNVYQYAQGDKPDFGDSVGNAMRKLLEAFSTFSYKTGMSELSTESIAGKLLEKPYREYFETLMYRLVLNGESHTQNRTKILDDPLFAPSYSEQEKMRMARDVLCMMYCMNKEHIICHLNKAGVGERTVVDQMQNWLRKIREEMGVN